ncbi:MAG: hypothetical protein AAGB34_10475 [Planctomycetota bacterium]
MPEHRIEGSSITGVNGKQLLICVQCRFESTNCRLRDTMTPCCLNNNLEPTPPRDPSRASEPITRLNNGVQLSRKVKVNREAVRYSLWTDF